MNDQTGPTGLVVQLRATRIEQGETLRPGTRVRVSFRALGERGMVADQVSPLPN